MGPISIDHCFTRIPIIQCTSTLGLLRLLRESYEPSNVDLTNRLSQLEVASRTPHFGPYWIADATRPSEIISNLISKSSEYIVAISCGLLIYRVKV